MTIVRIDHVQLAMPVGGEPLAVGFYSELLGIPEVPKPSELAARGGCWFESSSVKVHLGVEASFQPARKAHPALVVSDLPALLTALRDHGAVVRVESPEQAYVDDPFGNRIELVAEG
jgi:catechol 2,3-dioxygenase-like lactoylglutathione lyase family enzyme